MRPTPPTLPDKIPLLTAKDPKIKPLKRSFFNLVLLAVNALLRFEVGPGLRLTKSPGRYYLEIDGDGVGSGIHWRGEWDAAIAYDVDDIFIYGSNNYPGHDYTAILKNGTKANTYIVRKAVSAGTTPSLTTIADGTFDVLARGAWDILNIITGDAYLSIDTTVKKTIDSTEYKDPTLIFRNHEVKMELKPSALRDTHGHWHNIEFLETNICWEDPNTGIKSTMAVMLPRSKVYDPSTGEDVES